MVKAVLYDLRRCIGCRACQVACKRWNDRNGESTTLSADKGTAWTNPPDFSAQTYTLVKFIEKGKGDDFRWHFVKWQCMHCVDPTCVTVCPTGALYKTKEGPVLYDRTICIGCKYCAPACPFNIPRYDRETGIVEKCTMCGDRIAFGLEPACVATCPTDALSFGERDEIIRKAESAESNGAYIYGKKELEGTSWIYILDVPPRELDFPVYRPRSATTFIRETLAWFAGVGIIGGAILYGLKLYNERRKKVEGGE